jgi:hypothetical protein
MQSATSRSLLLDFAGTMQFAYSDFAVTKGFPHAQITVHSLSPCCHHSFDVWSGWLLTRPD